MRLTEKQVSELKRIAEQETGLFGPIESARIFKPSLGVLATNRLVRRHPKSHRYGPVLVVLTREGWDFLYALDPDFVQECAGNYDGHYCPKCNDVVGHDHRHGEG